MDGEAVVMRRKRAVARVCITPVFVYCVRLGMMISGSFFAQTLIENFDVTIDLFGFQNFDEG